MPLAMDEAGGRIVSGPRFTGDGYYEALITDTEGNFSRSLHDVTTDGTYLPRNSGFMSAHLLVEFIEIRTGRKNESISLLR